MSGHRRQARCARCGHPKGKHTRFMNPGCTVSTYGRNGQVAMLCPCRGFKERVN